MLIFSVPLGYIYATIQSIFLKSCMYNIPCSCGQNTNKHNREPVSRMKWKTQHRKNEKWTYKLKCKKLQGKNIVRRQKKGRLTRKQNRDKGIAKKQKQKKTLNRQRYHHKNFVRSRTGNTKNETFETSLLPVSCCLHQAKHADIIVVLYCCIQNQLNAHWLIKSKWRKKVTN